MDRLPFSLIIFLTLLISLPIIFIVKGNSKPSTTLSIASPSPTNSPLPNVSASSSAVLISSATPSPSPTARPTSSTTPTPTTSSTKSNWQYPNSTKISDNQYQSNDDPTIITDWYKDKIRATGMKTTTFVTTNSNNNILNKLAAANQGEKIAVEIKKNSGDSTTAITLSIP